MSSKFLLGIFLIAGSIFYSHHVFAYDDQTTHPALSDQIVDFYNQSFPDQQITPEQKEWIVQGSVLEDTPPRWINHFYDPVHETGWTGDKAGAISQSVVQKVTSIGLSAEEPLSAVEWLNSYLIQESYKDYGGNRSWKRGLEYFAEGDEKEAYITLGHVLHLLEDMGVPDHTRNDTHAHDLQSITGDFGSPLEEYSKKWDRGTIAQLNIPKALVTSTIPIFQNPDDYLISAAKYSNNYFFSKDTTNDPKYELPKIIKEDSNVAFGADFDGSEFPLALIDFKKDQFGNLKKSYSLKERQEYEFILDAYFDRLSKKIVLNGAGLVRLFQKEAEDARINKDYPQHVLTLDAKKLVIPNFSLFGLITKTAKSFSGGLQQTKIFVFNSAHSISNLFANLLPKTQNKPLGSMLVEAIPEPYVDNSNSDSNYSEKAQADLDLTSADKIILADRGDDIDQVIAENKVESSSIIVVSQSGETPALVLPFVGGGGSGVETLPVVQNTNGGAQESETVLQNQNVNSNASSSQRIISGPIPTNGETVIGKFVSSTMSIELNWQASPDLPVDTSTIFSIYDLHSGTPAFIEKTTSTFSSIHIVEVGRDYSYEIEQRDGLGNLATSSAAVAVPSFSKNYFFDDDGQLGGGRVMEIFYDSYPFIPGNDMWQAMVFYLNSAANSSNTLLETATQHNPADLSGVLQLKDHAAHSAIFSIDPARTNGVGGGLNNKSFLLPYEDKHLVLQFMGNSSTQPLSSLDFVTVAYYSFCKSGGGTQDLCLIATDNNKINFGTQPLRIAPETPKNFKVTSFLPFDLAVRLDWEAAADPDTPDSKITYELAKNNSGDFASAIWEPVFGISTSTGLLSGGTNYFGLRAVDEFGNYSPGATSTFDFPAGFIPAPRQTGHSANIGRPGEQKGQSISFASTTAVAGIALWGRMRGGPYGGAQMYVEIFDDSSSTVGIATSALSGVGQYDPEREMIFNFTPAISLSPGMYRFVPVLGNYNSLDLYGEGGNLYVDGAWTGDPAGDIDLYFRIKREGE